MSESDGVVDLRSDTVTTPTPEMRRAMADAEVGDDAYGEDPTVRRLESLAAGLLGKEAALYVPSGTMANQLALRLLARPGTEVLCGERAHVYRYEHAAAAAEQRRAAPAAARCRRHAGTRRRGTRRGIAAAPPARDLRAVPREHTHAGVRAALARQPSCEAVTAVARDAGFAVHCDGARIWNAAIALGTVAERAHRRDRHHHVLPVEGVERAGGLVALRTARRRSPRRATHRPRLGGGMRQAGVIAAAGVVALETMVERLADDHARARTLADALADAFPGSVDPATVETNIVCARAAALPPDLARRARGSRGCSRAPSTSTPCGS